MEELKHHGVRGQKWGIRRYQNKDGSLTPAGRKRADKLKSKYLEVTGKQLKGRALSVKPKATKSTKVVKEEPKKAKTINELSDDELRARTSRMKLESDYIEATSRLNNLQPKKVSLGKKIVGKVMKDVITPAAVDIGKQVTKSYMVKFLNKQLNLPKELQLYTNNKKKDK